MGIILAEAIGIYDGKYVAQTQSYGPEARGGSSKSEVIVSDEEIDYPKAMELDLLLAMNQKSCDDFYPDLRPEGLLDDMIAQLAEGGLDSVVAAKRENKAIWQQKDGIISQIEEGLTPRQFKEPTYIELKGIGCVTHPEFLREGKLLGEKVGIYELNNPYSHLEVRSEDDFKLASSLIKEMFR